MKKTVFYAAMVLAGLTGGGNIMMAQAHHSFPATYKVDETAQIRGTVSAFMFRNPHSFVHVQAPDKEGKIVTWTIEWAAGGVLAGQGVDANTLKTGDKVIIKGNPARDPKSHRLRMLSAERPGDGWKWSGTFG